MSFKNNRIGDDSNNITTALAIIELVLAGKPGGNFFHGKTINFGTPYYTITIALNIIVTLLIVFRLQKLSRAVSQALGRDTAKMYTSISSILIESAAPYSLVGIMFLIPYAMKSPTAISFGQVWAKITVCPSLFLTRHTHHFRALLVFISSIDRTPRCHWSRLGTRSHHPSPERCRICDYADCSSVGSRAPEPQIQSWKYYSRRYFYP